MSKKDKFAGISAGLGEALDKLPVATEAEKPRTAPGQLIAFRNEMIAYEDKITALEARVKDLESTAIPVADISPNPWQPRRIFDDTEIQKLAGSIAEIGLIQPIVVRSVGNPNTQFQLIAGERRFRAIKSLGRSDIKAIVIEASDEEMAALALAENFDREDLTAYEIALAIKNAEAAFPNRKSLAAALGINRSDLYSFLAFFALPEFILQDLEKNPALLGRDAAKDVKVVLERHGESAVSPLGTLWPRVKSGDLDQGKIAGLIEAAVTKGTKVTTERDIKKLFVSGQQAGSITRDSSNLTVKIRTVALTPEKEVELRAFVEKMFS
jgi:ParB family chromosome partitioning protein